MKADETIEHPRQLLHHPLALDDDMRLVSTVELIIIREGLHDALSPLDGPVLPTISIRCRVRMPDLTSGTRHGIMPFPKNGRMQVCDDVLGEDIQN